MDVLVTDSIAKKDRLLVFGLNISCEEIKLLQNKQDRKKFLMLEHLTSTITERATVPNFAQTEFQKLNCYKELYIITEFVINTQCKHLKLK